MRTSSPVVRRSHRAQLSGTEVKLKHLSSISNIQCSMFNVQGEILNEFAMMTTTTITKTTVTKTNKLNVL